MLASGLLTPVPCVARTVLPTNEGPPTPFSLCPCPSAPPHPGGSWLILEQVSEDEDVSSQVLPAPVSTYKLCDFGPVTLTWEW